MACPSAHQRVTAHAKHCINYLTDTNYNRFNAGRADTTVGKNVFRSTSDANQVAIPCVGSSFRIRSNLVLGWQLRNLGVS